MGRRRPYIVMGVIGVVLIFGVVCYVVSLPGSYVSVGYEELVLSKQSGEDVGESIVSVNAGGYSFSVPRRKDIVGSDGGKVSVYETDDDVYWESLRITARYINESK